MLDDSLEEFKRENCEVLAISTSSVLSKMAFLSLNKEQGGVAGIRFGLVEDKDGEISHKYGVMREGSGYTYRAMVLIDKEGMIIFRSVSYLSIGLRINAALRIVKQANGHNDDGGTEASLKASMEAEDAGNPDGKVNSMVKKTNDMGESDKTIDSEEMINTEIKSNTETGEKLVNSNDKENPKGSTIGEKTNAKSDKSAVGKAGDVGPEMCDCDLGYSHTGNLHKLSTLEKREKPADTE